MLQTHVETTNDPVLHAGESTGNQWVRVIRAVGIVLIGWAVGLLVVFTASGALASLAGVHIVPESRPVVDFWLTDDWVGADLVNRSMWPRAARDMLTTCFVLLMSLAAGVPLMTWLVRRRRSAGLTYRSLAAVVGAAAFLACAGCFVEAGLDVRDYNDARVEGVHVAISDAERVYGGDPTVYAAIRAGYDSDDCATVLAVAAPHVDAMYAAVQAAMTSEAYAAAVTGSELLYSDAWPDDIAVLERAQQAVDEWQDTRQTLRAEAAADHGSAPFFGYYDAAREAAGSAACPSETFWRTPLR